MKGGVLGGALMQGELKVGDTIEIAPGIIVDEKNQKVAKPLTTIIKTVMTGGKPVELVGPGGSMAMLTGLDPGIVKSDSLTGSVVGLPGKLPPIISDMKLKVSLLDRVVGSKDDLTVEPIKMGEPLMLNVNSAATVGMVNNLKKDIITAKLKLPVCADIGSRVTISRRIGNRFRLIGYGFIEWNYYLKQYFLLCRCT